MFLHHKQVLIAQRDAIVKDLQAQDVFTFLRAEFVLTENDEDMILHETTRRTQTGKLLDILLLKGEDAFKWFLGSLEEKYSHLASLLLRESKGSSQCVDIGDGPHEECHPMSQYHRDLLTSKRAQIVDDLLVDDILPYLMGKFVLNDDDQEIICAELTRRLKAGKCLDLLATRGDNAFGHFVDSLRAPYGHLAQILVADNRECPSRRSDGATSIKRGMENIEIVENLRDQLALIHSQINKVCQEVKRKNGMEAKEKMYLPEKSSSFIGRKQEIEDTISLLQEKMVGVVSIVGGPGIGKSTTAIEIAHDLNDHHKIPVFFAYLRGATTVSEVIVSLCHAMGIQPQQDPKSSLIFYLRGMRTNCVLVMDNIEQLLEETTQDAFIDLLRLLRINSSKQLQILLTSRSCFVISDLKSEDIALKELPRNLSIQLVRECHPGKCLNNHFLNSLAKICGDMPLALRIAASRLQDFSDPEELLKCLQDDVMEVLETSTEKVEKSIEMSFNRFSNQVKNDFVCLSVFDGNFDKKAVQEVTALQGILLQNFLTSLVNKNLIERRGERYSIHTLIRSYLIKRGKSDEFSPERELSQGKMVKYFLNVCHKLTQLYWSKDGSTKARRLLQEDAHNVKKVLTLCQESRKEEITQSLRESQIFQSSCKFFYHFVLHILPQPLILSFLDTCAKLAKKHKDAGIELLVQCLISHMLGRISGWKSSEYTESIKVAKETYSRNEEWLEERSKLEACSYYMYSQYMCHKEPSSGDEAKDKLQSYLELKKKEGQSILEKVDAAITLLQLGRVHSQGSEATKSIDCYKEALRCFERLLGDHDLKLCCHKELGDLHHEQGDHKQAVSHYEDAMEVHRQLGASNSNISSVYLLKNYGLSLTHMSRMEEGIAYQIEALDVAQKLFKDHLRCRIEVYCGLAETFDKYPNGCSQAVKFAKKALDKLGSNCYSGKGVNLKEKMSKIIERENQNKPELSHY